ncbi:MAG: UDP-N-acetylmuramyl pentapeptide phosphotransferase [Clostridia bacterium]|nr:UDP-N-acetylmuramyl pentapeptide phosphotransferase [Clostridia bacterium]
MSSLFLLLSGYLVTKAVLPLSLRAMLRGGLIAENYQGVLLPFPAGLIPVTVFLSLVAIHGLWSTSGTWTVFFLCFGLALLGLWDDLKGSPDYKGFRGHLKALSEGHFSTGFIKASVGGLLALCGAWSLGERETEHLIINTLLIALLTNFFNLLDLRPGRTLKIFLAIAVLFLWFFPVDHFWLPALLGPMVAYFPWDLTARGMLGDTGANLLGFVLGLSLITLWGLPEKLIILVVLIGIQIYAEKFSITELIERYPILRYMDRWGRPEH